MTTETTPIRLPYLAEAIAPAYSAEGQQCGQCGAPAWHIQAMPFCLAHDQETIAATYR